MSDAIVERAKTEALRLVNRSRAEWPEEAVEHAARRAAEMAREEERERIADRAVEAFSSWAGAHSAKWGLDIDLEREDPSHDGSGWACGETRLLFAAWTKAAELAREECAKEIIELGAKLHIDITKKLGRGAEGWGAACAYLAAAIRAGSGE